MYTRNRLSVILIGVLFFMTEQLYSSSSQSNAARDFLAVKTPKGWGWLDVKGANLIDAGYVEVGEFSEGMASFQRSGKVGFVNEEGREKIGPMFQKVKFFSEGLAPAMTDSKWGFVGPDGGSVIKPIFEDGKPFSFGLASVKIKGKWGYINKSGEIVIKEKFSDAGRFFSNFAIVTFAKKSGLIDTNGLEIQSVRFDEIQFGDWGFLVRENKKSGVLGLNGQWVIAVEEQELTRLNNGYWRILKKEKVGFADQSGKVVCDPKFDSFDRGFNDGFMVFYRKEKRGYVSTNGNIVGEDHYQELNVFSEGLAATKKKGIWSFMDHNGKEIFSLPKDYTSVGNCSEGFIWARKGGVLSQGGWVGGSIHFFNKAGSKVFETKYVDAKDFNEGLALVVTSSAVGAINKSGEEVVKPKFRYIYPFKNGIAMASEQAGKWGILSSNGNWIVEPKLDEIAYLERYLGFSIWDHILINFK